jgi:hypothetical protein
MRPAMPFFRSPVSGKGRGGGKQGKILGPLYGALKSKAGAFSATGTASAAPVVSYETNPAPLPTALRGVYRFKTRKGRRVRVIRTLPGRTWTFSRFWATL